jgi:hypothetical protein
MLQACFGAAFVITMYHQEAEIGRFHKDDKDAKIK